MYHLFMIELPSGLERPCVEIATITGTVGRFFVARHIVGVGRPFYWMNLPRILLQVVQENEECLFWKERANYGEACFSCRVWATATAAVFYPRIGVTAFKLSVQPTSRGPACTLVVVRAPARNSFSCPSFGAMGFHGRRYQNLRLAILVAICFGFCDRINDYPCLRFVDCVTAEQQ